MSLRLRSGPDDKDLVIFATKEDHATPSTVTLPEPEVSPGLILPNGDINWNCPCLGGMATGPCGIQFREAFSCFHYSEAEPKGSDCYDVFSTMQDCMAKYPTVYNKDDTDDNDDSDPLKFEDMEEAGKSKTPDPPNKENNDSKDKSEKKS